jgi:hypothetical protein
MSKDFSQFGEQIIIEKLLSTLGINGPGWSMEFGAWDGQNFSNTRFLAEKGWNQILIEPNARRYELLKIKSEQLQIEFKSKILCFNDFVNERKGSKIEDFLEKSKSPKIIDVLSIDIDGDDLAAFTTIGRYRSKIVCIEYNPTMPADFVYLNPIGSNSGNSIAAIEIVFQKFDYVLVAQTQTNLIFVDRDLAEHHKIKVLNTPKTFTNIWVGYDGKLNINHTTKTINSVTSQFVNDFAVPWPWTLSFVPQPIPKLFRKWPRNQIILTIVLFFRHVILHPSFLTGYIKSYLYLRNKDNA